MGVSPLCRLLGVVAALAAIPPALAQSPPGDCTGVDFDVRNPLVVSRIVADAPRVHFVKSAWEDAACPSEQAACRAKAYLVPGDRVLTGRPSGPFTCVAYQSPRDRKQVWTSGWISSAQLAAVAPARAPRLSDWIGTWTHPGG